jgi:hypothetical protein
MTDDRMAAALARLSASRAVLRQAMQHDVAAGKSAANSQTPLPDWLSGLKNIGGFKDLPGFDLMVAALRKAWAQQPLKKTAEEFAQATSGFVQPLAQRYPTGIVVAALALGAIATRLRPWRWGPVQALAATLAPALGARLLAALLKEINATKGTGG